MPHGTVAEIIETILSAEKPPRVDRYFTQIVANLSPQDHKEFLTGIQAALMPLAKLTPDQVKNMEDRIRIGSLPQSCPWDISDSLSSAFHQQEEKGPHVFLILKNIQAHLRGERLAPELLHLLETSRKLPSDNAPGHYERVLLAASKPPTP
jgi:hypothetical protein